jgi:hypothetical protein
MKKSMFLVCVMVAVVAFAVSGSFGQAVKKQIEIVKIEDIDNPNAEFTIDLKVDREDATYKIGDPIVFTFKTNKDCRLTLLNKTTSGTVQVIFPNEYHQDDLVKAGTTYRIPAENAKYIFKAKGPAGEDIVKAIAALDQVVLVNPADLKPAGPFQEAKISEEQLTKQIEIALKPISIKRWAEKEKMIKVVEK